MRSILLFLSILLFGTGFAQTVEETHPGTLWCANDTFYLRFKGDEQRRPYRVSRENNESPGTDAAPGEYAVLYYGTDSLLLRYHNNLPYAHIFYINFGSPKGKTRLRFHFNDLAAYFPEAYIRQHTGDIQFSIPEVYELANIIWTLSPSGQRAQDLYKAGPYYNRVQAYFKPYLDHPIFKALDLPDSLYIQRYYTFRENSFAFNFEEPQAGAKSTKLLYNGPYYFVFGDEMADSSFFGKLKPLVEDFARRSKFRAFYKNNLPYYTAEIRRQQQLLPVKQMWTWLEEQFPKPKFKSYRIVFSPLIGGSHSTQNYSTYLGNELFRENVMFICGTGRVDTVDRYTEKQREGLMSGIVFTEIDHNYVNPTTRKYIKTVDSIFSHRERWTKATSSTNWYGSPESVFNEYMTHAAFCLYVLDRYDAGTAELVITHREALMEERRNFSRFRAFNRQLLQLHREQPRTKLADLFPAMLDWCRKQE